MRPIRAVTVLTATLAALAAVTGCSASGLSPTSTSPTPPPQVTITFTSPSETSEIPHPDQITPETAKQLCDMISPKIDDWRTDTSTTARADFNLVVHDWAARSGGLNTKVLTDRALVDRVTTQTCPDTRQQALQALKVGNLADDLVGFGK
ncbi:hypothetical protein [Nocardia miyunensis]|uniref:hypothetical protein n=1 Tax=Nocardia miyunensis TaxID=282684 RepID=UPI00082ED85A|nr:hypothetical protein [Nocardia miyunensis]